MHRIYKKKRVDIQFTASRILTLLQMCLFLYQHCVQLLIYEKKSSYIVCRGRFIFFVMLYQKVSIIFFLFFLVDIEV